MTVGSALEKNKKFLFATLLVLAEVGLLAYAASGAGTDDLHFVLFLISGAVLILLIEDGKALLWQGGVAGKVDVKRLAAIALLAIGLWAYFDYSHVFPRRGLSIAALIVLSLGCYLWALHRRLREK